MAILQDNAEVNFDKEQLYLSRRESKTNFLTVLHFNAISLPAMAGLVL